mmetsp:Transcript_4117/g.10801  ORF Transcript_4117/g.10801 Transcript_4117/m.10801 type:complete len:382 (-) Transcript_4117:226-1371(-)
MHRRCQRARPGNPKRPPGAAKCLPADGPSGSVCPHPAGSTRGTRSLSSRSRARQRPARAASRRSARRRSAPTSASAGTATRRGRAPPRRSCCSATRARAAASFAPSRRAPRRSLPTRRSRGTRRRRWPAGGSTTSSSPPSTATTCPTGVASTLCVGRLRRPPPRRLPRRGARERASTHLAAQGWGGGGEACTRARRAQAETVQLLKIRKPSIKVECLVSDFAGDESAVATLAGSGLDVFAHNMETVERLQRHVRDNRANYAQSLQVLRAAKRHAPEGKRLLTKTSLMLGLGETADEVVATMRDLRAAGVDVVTFGQYLRPTDNHLAVVEYVRPELFDWYREQAEQIGFAYVASGPMVRSSYKAGEFFMAAMVDETNTQSSE